jgi:sporulation-control protein spo0M
VAEVLLDPVPLLQAVSSRSATAVNATNLMRMTFPFGSELEFRPTGANY